MSQRSPEPGVRPDSPLPEPEAAEQPVENPEGSNATIHQPDPDAEQHPVRPGRKTRFSYTTGNQ